MNLETIEQKQKELHEAFAEHKKAMDARLEQVEKRGESGVDQVTKDRAEKAFDQVMQVKEDLESAVKQFNAYKEKEVILGEKENEKHDRFEKYLKLAENGDETGAEVKRLFFTEGDSPRYCEKKAKGYQKAFEQALRQNSMRPVQEHLKSMNVINDNAGGFLIAPVMGELITNNIQEFSPFHQFVDNVEIMADSIEYPTTNRQVGASRAHEMGSRSETTAPTFGQVSIKPEDIYAEPRVTQRMLDVRPDMESWLAQVIAEQFIITEANEMAVNAGPMGCRGITTYDAGTGVGQIEQVNTGAAATIDDFDSLIDLVAKLKPVYRSNARFHATRLTFSVIAKLKDIDGQYLWKPDLQGATATSLLGYPVVESEDMPELGTNALSVLFGDLRAAYKLVTMPGMRVIRDNVTAKPYILMNTTRRSAGGLVVGEALKLLKCST